MGSAAPLHGITEDAGALAEGVTELRRRLHERPELGLQLPRTQAAVLEALDGLPLLVTEGTTTTSVLAVLEGERPGPTVLLRGDMDGLPLHEDTDLPFSSRDADTMHACGHDAHTAMLVGAARLLARRRGDLAGRVAFMFQPGEEGHHGARFMLEDGLLAAATGGLGASGVAGAFALHVFPQIDAGHVFCKAGPALASADKFRVVVTGRGGHASAPHHAVDPIPVACEIVLALNVAMTRRIDIFDPGVLTVAKIAAGTTDNVIPETASILGTIRALSERARTRVHEQVHQVAAGIAAAHGATVEVEVELGFPVTVNDPAKATFLLDTVGQLLGERSAHVMPTPTMGSEDWSYVLQQVPGAMGFLGCKPAGVREPEPNHSNRFLLDEACLPHGVALHAALAVRTLHEAETAALA